LIEWTLRRRILRRCDWSDEENEEVGFLVLLVAGFNGEKLGEDLGRISAAFIYGEAQ
jgi:hypothetical protein